MSNTDGSVGNDDFDECWCCGGLHDRLGALCPACDDAGCKHFGGDCQSDHKPVMPDGGAADHGARTTHSIIPDDFNLASARSKKSSTPNEDQPQCPHCGSVNITHKTGHYFESNHRKDGMWRCNYDGCNSHFDEPEWGDGDV